MGDLRTKQKVVIKQMKRFPDDDRGLSSTSLRETSLLKILKHDHIAELLDCFFTDSMDFCLVFGHCQMDLAQYIESKKKNVSSNKGSPVISGPLVRKWAFQMVDALCFMHSHRILHR